MFIICSLGFLALPILILAVLSFESIISMLLNLGLDDVVNTDTTLLETFYLNACERLDRLAVIDEFVRGISVLWVQHKPYQEGKRKLRTNILKGSCPNNFKLFIDDLIAKSVWLPQKRICIEASILT